MTGYPADWPRCLCGQHVIDGHLTCGAAMCGESDARKRANRQSLVARMAEDLGDHPECATERDAVRALMACPKLFRLGDIAILAEEALQEARRRATAKADQA